MSTPIHDAQAMIPLPEEYAERSDEWLAEYNAVRAALHLPACYRVTYPHPLPPSFPSAASAFPPARVLRWTVYPIAICLLSFLCMALGLFPTVAPIVLLSSFLTACAIVLYVLCGLAEALARGE